MDWFAMGIDPLLNYLDRRLVGIPVISLPVLGPPEEGQKGPLSNLVERFKVMASCDDLKPAICSIEEFLVADTGHHSSKRQQELGSTVTLPLISASFSHLVGGGMC